MDTPEEFVTSSFTRIIQGRTVVATCDRRLAEQVAWLLTTIEETADETSTRIHDAWTFELGFSVIVLVEHNNTLILCEPDFDDNPFEQVVEDISRSLWIAVMQREVCDITGTTAYSSSPRFDETVSLGKNALEQERIIARRMKPRSSNGLSVQDSGWYIEHATTLPDNHISHTTPLYESRYLYELVQKRPMILSILALPEQYSVIIHGDEIEAVYDEHQKNVWHPYENKE
ncbi:MAG: hypothetical protein RML40_05945 [Bacteroidota bacterium]|nr:hypothetical protein [Candidatus Kapabacteria bacterium]MDW8220055.1 hypothetical protein [Bacteroidota bacterium]